MERWVRREDELETKKKKKKKRDFQRLIQKGTFCKMAKIETKKGGKEDGTRNAFKIKKTKRAKESAFLKAPLFWVRHQGEAHPGAGDLERQTCPVSELQLTKTA